MNADAIAVPADLNPIVCDSCAGWNAPQDSFRLHGRSFYVGTAELSVVAIRTDAGVILIDGALPQSVPGILERLKSHGIAPEDIKFIAISHPHFDHVGGVAALSRLSGATVLSTASGVEALRAGTASAEDPQAGFGDFMKFPPIASVRALADGEAIQLGEVQLTLRATPGHTPGGASWHWQSCEAETCIDMVYADSLTPISDDEYRFSEGDRAAVFSTSIDKIAAMPCDLLITAHPSFSDLFARQAAGELIQAEGCKRLAEDARERLQKRLGEETAGD